MAGKPPEAPDILPSVTKAIFNPLDLKTPIIEVSLCNSGIPLEDGPWFLTTIIVSDSNSLLSNALITSS